MYNFDKVIDRKNTDSLKYDFTTRRGMSDDVLPLWVADMDFEAPKEVIDVMIKKSQHGIFGYSEGREDYFEAVASWFKRYFDWEVKSNWLIKTPGVVYAVAMAVKAYTNRGESILIQEPVYYPFKETIEANERAIVINELIYENHQYSIDFQKFEEQIISENVKMFILCSPHNPVGRVWTQKELETMGDICLKHSVLVVSDEIHADFIYPGHKHYVFADIKPEYQSNTITCTAPSKTFNLAALQISNIFIVEKALRKKFLLEMTKSGYSQPNIMGLISCQAAYTYGHEWLIDLKIYLKENIEFLKKFFNDNIPDARVIEPEGTYLVWVDMSEIKRFEGYSSIDIDSFMSKKAKLWLDGGTMFGESGKGFQRFNIACPRSILEQALLQLKEALEIN